MILKIYPSYRNNESNECTPSNIFTLFRRIPLVGNLHASATFSVYNHIQNIAEGYAQILQLLRAGLKFRPYTVLIIKYLITIFTHPLERGEKIILQNGLKNCLENTTCLQCREFLVRGPIAVNATNRHSSQMFFKFFYLFFLEIGRQFRRKV